MEAEEENTNISGPAILLKPKKEKGGGEEEAEECPKSLLSQSQGRKNPFKVRFFKVSFSYNLRKLL
jgi:hypothetical protein